MKKIIFLILFYQVTTIFAQSSNPYHAAFDDSTLQPKSPLTLMPFNRLIHSAGKVVTYGDPALENHALDFAILPGNQSIVIEDRYGIAVLDVTTRTILSRWSFNDTREYKKMMSVYSGIKSFDYGGNTYIVWGAAAGGGRESELMIAEWKDGRITLVTGVPIAALPPASGALPNDIAVHFEDQIPYLYVVLNGNNQLLKIRFNDRKTIWAVPTGEAPYGIRIIGQKAYVTNWAGSVVRDSLAEHAGIPWGDVYTNPVTGGTERGSLSIIDLGTGKLLNELPLGLHPNAITASPDKRFLYICNANSDNISVVDVAKEKISDSIPVGLFSGNIPYYGSSPNALQVDASGQTLYVANGFDNAVCVIHLGGKAAVNSQGPDIVRGYIPTEAYPGGLALLGHTLYVANIEAKGSRVLTEIKALQKVSRNSGKDQDSVSAYTVHQELASISIIPLPGESLLKSYTQKVKEQSLFFRIALTNRAPRLTALPKPVPERIGEPSVFKHVVYIIKENKTYDQVYGDMPMGRGIPQLCTYGDSITPNQHLLSKDFLLLDNYYASGKSSAEGHQWTDAAMVSDYIEKSVRAWFRSYPHRQNDALVYNKNGFIWNDALDHGKSVRIYGEACLTSYDKSLKWLDIYNAYLAHKNLGFTNTTTIARIRPVISPSYPDCDNFVFTDQLRAETFIREWNHYEEAPGDSLPDLMVISLPDDHTAGTSPGFPVPKAMVADNDLALGRIIDVITHSRFWDSTVVFVTEDDSQSGWDHISSYRTTGLVISPYSVLGKPVHTNYNQTSMVRTIEQILGIPPLNVLDASALPMFDCFSAHRKTNFQFTHLANTIPLNTMNRPLSELTGKAYYYAKLSSETAFKELDGGEDDLMNKILWFDAKGNARYPAFKK